MIVGIRAHTEQAGRCRSCGRPVVWAILLNGSRHPFDPPLVIVDEQSNLFEAGATVHHVDARKSPSHFATCPHASQHRTRGNRKDRS